MRIAVQPYSSAQTRMTLSPENEAEQAQIEQVCRQLKETKAEFDAPQQWKTLHISFTIEGEA